MVLSAASPYKFTGSVLAALGEEASEEMIRRIWRDYLKSLAQRFPGPLSAIFERGSAQGISSMWTR